MVRDERMDRRQDITGVGEQILGAVQDAIASGDFGKINQMVQYTADTALSEIRNQVGEGLERLQARPRAGYMPQVRWRGQMPRRYFHKRGKPLGVLLTLIGGVGFALFGLTACLLLMGFLVDPDSSLIVVMVFFALFSLGCASAMKSGIRIRKRLRLAERYVKVLRGTMYMEVEDLALRVGQDAKKVRKNLKEMMRIGMFPEGHMDAKGTLFVLSDEIWEQYLAVQKSWKQKEYEQPKPMHPQEEPEELSEEEAIEEEGMQYLDKLRELNARIQGEEISNKLYQLDYLLQRIFAVLRDHPAQCPKMNKFMEYYLPTTVKLVESYADFDKAGIQGEQILSAKTEIEKTLHSINEAFEKLLDDMYQNAAFEAAADAKVLKTILAQDGYMKSEFSADAGKEG